MFITGLRLCKIVVILQCCFGQFVFAQEVREFYQGVRSLGMGGAAIAVVNDETALLHNPAGLGKLRDYYGTIFDPEYEFGSQYGSILLKKGISNQFEVQDVKDSLDQSPGKFYHNKLQLFPSFVVRNFGIGIFAQYQMQAEMNSELTEMNTYFRDDLAAVVGFNLRLWDGRIKLGANARLVSRIEIDKVVDTSGSLTKDDLASEGVGIANDVGLILTAPWTYLPTISAVVRDVGDTKFTSGSGLRLSTSERPNTVEQDMDVAIAFFPIHGNRSRSSFTLEYQKIKASADSEDKIKYYHAGYEFNYADVIFLRLGMNGRYATGGFELASEHMQFQLATYGEEIGTNDSLREDRRYVAKFALRF